MTAEKMAAMVLIWVSCDEVCISRNPLKLFKRVSDLQKVSGDEVDWTLLNWQRCVLDCPKTSEEL